MAATTDEIKNAIAVADTKSGNEESYVFTSDDLTKREQRRAGGNSNAALRNGDEITVSKVNKVKPQTNTRAREGQSSTYPGFIVDILRNGANIDQALSVNTPDATVYPATVTLHKVATEKYKNEAGEEVQDYDYYVALADQQPRFKQLYHLGETSNQEIDGKKVGVLTFPQEIKFSVREVETWLTEFNSYNGDYKAVKVRKDPFTHQPMKSKLACDL